MLTDDPFVNRQTQTHAHAHARLLLPVVKPFKVIREAAILLHSTVYAWVV